MSEYDLGYIVGVVVGLVAAGVILVVLGRKNRWKYDERQLLARGAAAKAALKIVVVGSILAVCANVADFDFLPRIGVSYILVGAMLLAAGVFACVCIYKDAWIALNERRQGLSVLYFIALAANIALGGFSFLRERLSLQTFTLLCTGAMLLLIGGNYLLKRVLDKRRSADEESEA